MAATATLKLHQEKGDLLETYLDRKAIGNQASSCGWPCCFFCTLLGTLIVLSVIFLFPDSLLLFACRSIFLILAYTCISLLAPGCTSGISYFKLLHELAISAIFFPDYDSLDLSFFRRWPSALPGKHPLLCYNQLWLVLNVPFVQVYWCVSS